MIRSQESGAGEWIHDASLVPAPPSAVAAQQLLAATASRPWRRRADLWRGLVEGLMQTSATGEAGTGWTAATAGLL